jgi:hypothetical protein
MVTSRRSADAASITTSAIQATTKSSPVAAPAQALNSGWPLGSPYARRPLVVLCVAQPGAALPHPDSGRRRSGTGLGCCHGRRRRLHGQGAHPRHLGRLRRPRGAPHGVWNGCWCTWFITAYAEKDHTAEGNRDLKKRRDEEGTNHAALVFDGDRAVAWCEYGTPEELPNIYHRKQYEEGLTQLPDYRLTCFFVDKGYAARALPPSPFGAPSTSSPGPAAAWSRPTPTTRPA